MSKKTWQVWTENEEESKKTGTIVDEKILLEGTESQCKLFAGKNINMHVGYACGEESAETKNQANNDSLTRVIFKMTPIKYFYPESECIAFLLDCDANRYSVLSYMHIGQHGEASIYFMRDCKLATPEQYEDLKSELESLGYILSIRKRWNGRK